MKSFNKNIVSLLLVVVLLLVFNEVSAQCPMCRMSAESNLKDGGTAGRGLNTGILYMLLLPYLLVASMGYWWWKNRKRQGEHPVEPFYSNTEEV